MEERGLLDEYVKNFDSHQVMETAKLFFEYHKIILCGRGLSHILCQWIASDLAGSQIPSMIVNAELNESAGYRSSVYGEPSSIPERLPRMLSGSS